MSDVKPVPDGYPAVSPGLAIDGAAAAIDFYKQVLGATERMRMPRPDGKIAHCELLVGESVVMLGDPAPDMGFFDPKAVGGTPVNLHVYVRDVDEAFRQAMEAGAKEIAPVGNQFYGDRTGSFEDPWGHRWTVATHVEDVPPDEMDRRMAELFGES
ncbi:MULTISPECIES: VOC family protein [Nocardia]|uniref:VOC family protein n=1 Tax=Nocardia TaxID=1817 RepID=UPI000BEFF111|nr:MULTISPECIES: VOC family protein [Nocardia]MBF6186609.1 VOC family protein [Nocardia farcinica]MBF6313696.1 VOC family protein [Nocardia farcinica]MBF6409129.1 VOC family protein [Nocardia farcinica]PEH74925.1 glyxoylase [Nocardia sp. FDAARGOS_372]UEX24451.1 VOC family protein [Nocardia farcinica]